MSITVREEIQETETDSPNGVLEFQETIDALVSFGIEHTSRLSGSTVVDKIAFAVENQEVPENVVASAIHHAQNGGHSLRSYARLYVAEQVKRETEAPKITELESYH